jgi:hypothetical protein
VQRLLETFVRHRVVVLHCAFVFSAKLRKPSALAFPRRSAESNELFETENTFLNVLISRNISFRIDEINIVKEKRIRKSSKDFANTI